VVQGDEEETEIIEIFVDTEDNLEKFLDKNEILELEIDTRGKDVDQIEAEIKAKLKKYGLDETGVNVVKVNDDFIILISDDEVKVR